MYGEFFDDNFNFRSWPEVLPVSQEHYKCVHLTCFLTNSCMANLKVMFSTSGHHRKYFRFPKNITNVTSNNICLLVSYNCQPRCFSYQFTYGEFFGHMFNFRSWPEVLPVFLRTLKLVTSYNIFSEQSEYAEFNENILNFRLWLPVTSGLSKTLRKRDLDVVFE